MQENRLQPKLMERFWIKMLFILELIANGSKYRYNLNKDHWYGDGGKKDPNHYPNANSKINIILQGGTDAYIKTGYNCGPDDDKTMCTYYSRY